MPALIHKQVIWIDFFNKSFKIKLLCCLLSEDNFIVSPFINILSIPIKNTSLSLSLSLSLIHSSTHCIFLFHPHNFFILFHLSHSHSIQSHLSHYHPLFISFSLSLSLSLSIYLSIYLTLTLICSPTHSIFLSPSLFLYTIILTLPLPLNNLIFSTLNLSPYYFPFFPLFFFFLILMDPNLFWAGEITFIKKIAFILIDSWTRNVHFVFFFITNLKKKKSLKAIVRKL